MPCWCPTCEDNGESTKQRNDVSDWRLDAAKFGPRDFAGMVDFDMEALKAYLMEKNNEGRVEHREALYRWGGNGGVGRVELGSPGLELACAERPETGAGRQGASCFFRLNGDFRA